MSSILQPRLENETLVLDPLRESDFEALYALASDPLIWEQHPNRDRWKREVFRTFFEGALQSGGAFVVRERISGQALGSTRFYDYDAAGRSILIGYTFYARNSWGKGINRAVKHLMLNHIFTHVDRVDFHIGAGNRRSQVAIERLGAKKVGEEEVAYFGERPKLNYVYRIEKQDWPSPAMA